MHLKLLLPTEIFLSLDVTKVIVEALNGHFCLKPRHVDFVSILVPSLLHYFTQSGRDYYIAIDQGVLIKSGSKVTVSTHHAIAGTELEELRSTVRNQYEVLDDHERAARTALARLEAGVVRRFINLEEIR